MASGKEYKLAIKIAGKVDPSLQKSAGKASSLFKSIVKADLVASGIKKVAGAVASFAGSAVTTYTDFNQAMANTAAIAGATGDTYEMLNDAAREAGKATTFTAAQSADALGYMALAGWDAETSAKALTPVLKLAEATQADLATTSDQVTDSMSAMGVGIDDLQGYLDVVVKTNNSANTTASDLMEAFIGCGGAAQAAGLNYNDAATALGILANNGTKGAEAGTALNAMLVRMTSKDKAINAMKDLGVSTFDSSGNMRNFKDVLVDVNGAMQGLSDAQKASYMSAIAGTNYYTKFQYLLQGVAEGADGSASSWDSLSESLDNSGGALDKMDAQVTNTVSGAMARLNSALDDSKISFMDAFGPDIIKGLDFISGSVMPVISSSMANMSKFLSQKVAPVVTKVIGYVQKSGIAGTMQKHIAATSKLFSDAFKLVGAGIKHVATWVQTSGFLQTIDNIRTSIVNAFQIVSNWIHTSGILEWLGTVFDAVGNAINGIVNRIANSGLIENVAIVVTGIINVVRGIIDWLANSGIFNNVLSFVHGIIDAISGIATFLAGVFTGNWQKAWQGIVDTFGGIFKTIGSVAAAPLNLVIGALNSAIGGLNKISVKIPDWVPFFGGKSYGFNIPTIPTIALASGGIATGPTNALIGEGGEPEAVMPLSKLAAMLGGGTGGGDIVFSPTIYVSGGASEEDVKASMSEAFAQFKAFMAQYERDKRRKVFAQ